MFYYLIVTTFVLALLVSFVVMRIFSSSINRILARIIHDPIHEAWARYTKLPGWWSGHPPESGFMTWKNTLLRSPIAKTTRKLLLN